MNSIEEILAKTHQLAPDELDKLLTRLSPAIELQARIRMSNVHWQQEVEQLVDSLNQSDAFRDYLIEYRLSEISTTAPQLSALHQQVYRMLQPLQERVLATSPGHLIHHEKQIFSQQGEDGIIEEIFNRIGITNRFFVEFGMGDGFENCCRHLVENRGWSGLWIEGDAAFVQQAQQHYADYDVSIAHEFIDRDNIMSLLDGIPAKPDLMVIDLDGNDYWIWQHISQSYQPRVLVMEYNGSFLPGKHWVKPYDATHIWLTHTNWYGASLHALSDLANQKGYTLVGCDSRGVNAFFVETSLIDDHFEHAGDVYALYRLPQYRSSTTLWIGHPYSTNSHRIPMEPISHIDNVTLQIATDEIPPLESDTLIKLPVTITNDSDIDLMSEPPHPIYLSYHWLRPDGNVVQEGIRTWLLPPSQASTQVTCYLRVLPPDPGDYILRISLVQEGVMWFHAQLSDCKIEIPVTVERHIP